MTSIGVADTPPDVAAIQIARWRSMTTAERAELLDRLCADVTALALTGIDRDLPGLDHHGRLRELARRRYGDELADAAYGTASTR